MFGSLSTPTVWQLIEAYESPLPNGDFDHTFNFQAVTFDNFSMLVLISEMDITSGSGQYTLIVNGITAFYDQYGRDIRGGVESIFDINDNDFFQLASNSIVQNTNFPCHNICYIMLNKGGNVGFESFTNGITVKANQVSTGLTTFTVNEITSIRIGGRIRGLRAGTRATLYKVSR